MAKYADLVNKIDRVIHQIQKDRSTDSFSKKELIEIELEVCLAISDQSQVADSESRNILFQKVTLLKEICTVLTDDVGN